jgi:hypothetical protein
LNISRSSKQIQSLSPALPSKKRIFSSFLYASTPFRKLQPLVLKCEVLPARQRKERRSLLPLRARRSPPSSNDFPISCQSLKTVSIQPANALISSSIPSDPLLRIFFDSLLRSGNHRPLSFFFFFFHVNITGVIRSTGRHHFRFSFFSSLFSFFFSLFLRHFLSRANQYSLNNVNASSPPSISTLESDDNPLQTRPLAFCLFPLGLLF